RGAPEEWRRRVLSSLSPGGGRAVLPIAAPSHSLTPDCVHHCREGDQAVPVGEHGEIHYSSFLRNGAPSPSSSPGPWSSVTGFAASARAAFRPERADGPSSQAASSLGQGESLASAAVMPTASRHSVRASSAEPNVPALTTVTSQQ